MSATPLSAEVATPATAPAPARPPMTSKPAIPGTSATARRAGKYGTRAIALLYLLMLLALPVAMVFIRTFEHGFDPVIEALDKPAFQHAFWLTVMISAIAVPINTIFGVVCALAIVRQRFPGRALLNALLDMPFAISPVVIGLSLILLYGKNSAFGAFLAEHGITVIFAVPGMIIATVFVSLPFVAREVIPVLREIGTDQEEAAYTLGASPFRTFLRITLPAIRWGVIYGVVLTTARSLGEFGAVAVVSGRIAGKTETLTLHVQDRYQAFELVGAFSASVVLALLAIGVLLLMNLFNRGRSRGKKAEL